MQMIFVIKQTNKKETTEKEHRIVWINRRLIPPIIFIQKQLFGKKVQGKKCT